MLTQIEEEDSEDGDDRLDKLIDNAEKTKNDKKKD